MSAPRIST
jgi:hypothetical protein